MGVDRGRMRPERNPRALAQRVPDAPEGMASTLSVAARAAGNHAIARLLARQPPARTSHFMAAPHATQVLQRFLQDPTDSRIVWMGAVQEYWREHGDRLMAMWDARGVAPPANLFAILERLAGEQPHEYTLEEVSEYVVRGRIAEDIAGLQEPISRNGDGPAFSIPSIVHFYWAGRTIDDGKVANLNHWAERAQNSGWQLWIWHDQDAVSEPRKTRKLRGEIRVMKVTPSVIDPDLQWWYAQFLRCRNYPAASDLARYSIMLRYGGVYADVDIGPGAMDFSRPLTLRQPFPLAFGPQLRDGEAVLHAIGETTKRPITEEDVRRAALARRKEGSFGNHFIAAQPGSPLLQRFVQMMSGRLKKSLERADEANGSAAFFTGQGALASLFNTDEMLELVRKRYLGDRDLKREAVIAAVFDHLVTDLPLDWVTPESEDQRES